MWQSLNVDLAKQDIEPYRELLQQVPMIFSNESDFCIEISHTFNWTFTKALTPT